jgi:hypothetical protein
MHNIKKALVEHQYKTMETLDYVMLELVFHSKLNTGNRN